MERERERWRDVDREVDREESSAKTKGEKRHRIRTNNGWMPIEFNKAYI